MTVARKRAAPGGLHWRTRIRIYREFNAGASIADLARKFACTQVDVERAMRWAEKWLMARRKSG